MEGNESTINRVGRAIWTVWGYLTGTVGRYLRPEVTNEETRNVPFKKEDTVPISMGYKELKVKEEEKETETKTSERKTREDLQYPGVKVRAAAVQWEKGNIAHDGHEAKDKSKHTFASSEGIHKQLQMKEDNEKTLDDKSGSSKSLSNQFSEQEDSPAYIISDINNQDRTFSGSEEADLNVGRNETNQEQTKNLEEEEKVMGREFEESEEEPIKSEFIDQGLLAKEADLHVERKENSQEQRKKEEEEAEDLDEYARKEHNETNEEPIKSECIGLGLLAKEADLHDERKESSQEQRRTEEEEGLDEYMRREYDETKEKPIESEFKERCLLVKEDDLNVGRNESNQEQTKKLEEEEDEKIMRREFDEPEEEPIKSEFIGLGLLAKEADLHVERKESSQEQRRKEEEGEECLDEYTRREYDETKEEPIKSEFKVQCLLVKEDYLNVGRNESSQELTKNLEEEEEEEEKLMREFDEPEEEPVKSEFIGLGLLPKEADLHDERNESSQEQQRTEEEEGLDEYTSREYDETKEEPVESEFIDQGLLAKEADLHVDRNESSQEQRGKQEEEAEGLNEYTRREHDETKEELIKSEFIEQGLLVKEADLNVERKENNQEQRRKQEHENVDEIMKMENDTTEEAIKGLLTKELDHENNQEQKNKQEEGVEITRRKNEDTGGEPIKSKSIEQGLLAKEAELNVERNENSQEQRKNQEEDEEITKTENETEEEPIQSELTDQDLLTKEADLNAEGSKSSEEQRGKPEEEGVDEFIRREYYETGEEPVKSTFTDRGLLAMEANLNVEKNEDSQEQRRESEEEEVGVDEISSREYDEIKEEVNKSEFAEQVDLNVERNEDNQEQRRKEDEEEEYIDIVNTENDETEEEPIKSGFTEQGYLAKEGDLNVERNENNQEQRRKQEDEILRREYDEIEEVPVKGKFIEPEPEEQASVCDMGDTVLVQEVSVEKIMECVDDQDKKELIVVEQSNLIIPEHENEVSKSQMVDEGMLIQLSSAWGWQDPLSDDLKLDEEMIESGTELQEKEVHEVDNEGKKQETVGKVNYGYHEQFSAWEKCTGTDIVEEQKVCDTEMKETLKPIEVDRNVDTECDLLEMAQKENAEVSEPSRTFEDGDNSLAVTVKLHQAEQSKEQKATSELALNIDLKRLDDKAHDDSGSQQPAAVTTQDSEGVKTRPETGAGNQTETIETTSEFRDKAVAMDVKKSAEIETSLCEQPIEIEEVAIQEIMGQCFLEQGSLLEDSAGTRINESSFLEAPSSEIKSVPLQQVDETAVESVDEMQGSSLQVLDECSIEAELTEEAKSSSPEQITDVSETLSEVTGMSEQAQPECEISFVENTCDESVLDETPFEDQINQDECTVQDSTAEASSQALYLLERESEQETLEMQRDSQEDTEEQERTDEAETGLLDEIKEGPSCLGVVEEITRGRTKESEVNEWEVLKEMEAPKSKEHGSELECHNEASESNMNVELLSDTRECEKELVAEMTDIERMVVSSGGHMESVKIMEEPVMEEEMDKCHLVVSELEASEGINRKYEEKVEHGESQVDSKEDVEERGIPGLKRGFEKMSGDNDEDEPDILLPSQASSLDFTFQKSKIAVKNPLVRPPKDPRMLINMASVEPLTTPHLAKPSFLKKSPIESAAVPPKGVIGFKLPGLGPGFPALRKTEAGRKIRDGEDSGSVTSQKSDSASQSADDEVKHETSPQKPKWTPPRQPGMGSPLMMAELKSKLKKPVKE